MIKHKSKSLFFSAALFIGIAFAFSASSAQQDMPVINISAKRFGFTPDHITVKKGETVKLRLTSEDVTHGFFMRALKIDETIEPGKPTEVTLTPQMAGTYTTICDHFCGVNHGNMKMTIVVE